MNIRHKSLILPITGVELQLKPGERLYFLAGPIAGGGDWQRKAIELLQKRDPNCYIACPRNYGPDDTLHRHKLEPTIVTEGIPRIKFPDQTSWEDYYMQRASWYGAIVFWLPVEDKHSPRKEPPYARDTYGEIGKWGLKSSQPFFFSFKKPQYNEHEHVNVIFGAEAAFPGLNTIQKNLNLNHKKEVPIRVSLEDTITAAVQLGKAVNPQPLLNESNA